MLVESLRNIETGLYGWVLYFFKIDRRNSNPYIAYKVRFKNNEIIWLRILQKPLMRKLRENTMAMFWKESIK